MWFSYIVLKYKEKIELIFGCSSTLNVPRILTDCVEDASRLHRDARKCESFNLNSSLDEKQQIAVYIKLLKTGSLDNAIREFSLA